MQSQGFLLNIGDPSRAPSNDFSVETQAVRLRGVGFAAMDVVQLEQKIGLPTDNLWSPVIRGGTSIQLTVTNTQHIELVSGFYRVTYSGTNAALAVWYETDQLDLDNNLVYVYTESVGGGGGGGSGFSLTADSTPSIGLMYVGTTSAGTITGTAIISPDGGNQLSIHGNGLYSAGTTVTGSSTQTITTTVVSNTVSSSLNISPDGGNTLTTHANGAYVPMYTGGTTNTAVDTVTGTIITTDVRVSANGGNTIVVEADGLFSPTAVYTGGTTNTSNVTVTGSVITNDVRVSPDGGNIITIHANGIYAAGGGGAFDMPFTDETLNFVVGTTYSAYRTPSATASLLASLPPATASNGQIFYFEDSANPPGTGTLTIAPNGTDLINGANTPLILAPGQSALMYSNGVDETSAINYVQLAPMQGTTPSCLSWINGPLGVGGLFGQMQISSTGGNAITFNTDGLYYDPPVLQQGITGVPGGSTAVTITNELITVVMCDSTLTATTVDIPASGTIAETVYLTIKNAGSGATTQTIHPVGGDTIEGSGSDVTLGPSHSITLTNSGTPSGWWIIGQT